VETVDNDGEVTTPVDTDIHQVDMFAMSNEGEMSKDDQGDSQESSNDTPNNTTGHRPLDPDTEKIHSRIDACIEAGGTLPTVKVADLLGCTFISEPNETGRGLARSRPRRTPPPTTCRGCTSSSARSGTRYLRSSRPTIRCSIGWIATCTRMTCLLRVNQSAPSAP
jgi:hypothetical protein